MNLDYFHSDSIDFDFTNKNILGMGIRGARIEPITEQGQIYVSESFAAISMLEKQPTFSCDYVGEIQLAKNYGTYRIYLLKTVALC